MHNNITLKSQQMTNRLNLMKATNIIWVTDGEIVDLPSKVIIPSEIENDEDAMINYLSDTYGFLVESFTLPMDGDDKDLGKK